MPISDGAFRERARIFKSRRFLTGLACGLALGFVAGFLFLGTFLVWSQALLRERAGLRAEARHGGAGPRSEGQAPLSARGTLLDRRMHLETVAGQPADLRRFGGRVLVLSVWASWCKPCIEELPSLEAAAAHFAKDQRVAFVALSTDTREELRSYLGRRALRLTVMRVPDGTSLGEWAELLPVTVVVAPSGRVLAERRGAAVWDDPETLDRLERLITEGAGT